MHRHRKGRHYKDRISKFLQDSIDPDLMKDAGGRVKSFIHEKPVMTACLGVAAGFLLGFLFRRGD